jgi:hypothetical protein
MDYYRQFPGSFFPYQPVPTHGGQMPGFPQFPPSGPQYPDFPGQPGGHQFPGFPGGPAGGTPPETHGGAPTSPPPSITPQKQQAGLMAVDPGSIRGCIYRYTYIWLRGWESFWFYPTHVGRKSVSGYRWTGFNWVYYGVSLRKIESFTCV